mgnify:CR=1 FL=1
MSKLVKLRCKPKGFFSWDFRVSGTADGVDILVITEMTTGGVIKLGEQRYKVREKIVSKDGANVCEGWKMQQNGRTIMRAENRDHSGADAVISIADDDFILKPNRMLRRGKRLTGDGYDVVIKSIHPFTRRTKISGAYKDIEVVLFAFWIVTYLKRAAKASVGDYNTDTFHNVSGDE